MYFIHIAPTEIKPSNSPQQELHTQQNTQVTMGSPYIVMSALGHAANYCKYGNQQDD
jgi:hypothetical protein